MPSYGRISYVVLVICVAVAVVLLVRWIAHSDYGRAISAMRDDEVAFAALGRDAKWMKISIFALGSGIAGFAGALYAHYFRFVTVEQFEILMSSTILTMVVVGGHPEPMGARWLVQFCCRSLPQAITFLNLPPVLLGPLQGLFFTGPRVGVHVRSPRRIDKGRHYLDLVGHHQSIEALRCWRFVH